MTSLTSQVATLVSYLLILYSVMFRTIYTVFLCSPVVIDSEITYYMSNYNHVNYDRFFLRKALIECFLVVMLDLLEGTLSAWSRSRPSNDLIFLAL